MATSEGPDQLASEPGTRLFVAYRGLSVSILRVDLKRFQWNNQQKQQLWKAGGGGRGWGGWGVGGGGGADA